MAPLCPSWKALVSTQICTMHIALNTLGRIPRRLIFWLPLTPPPQYHQPLLPMWRVIEYSHRSLMGLRRRERMCGRFHHRAASCTRHYQGSPRSAVPGAIECQILTSSRPPDAIPPANSPKMTITMLDQNPQPIAQSCLARLLSDPVRRLPKPDGSFRLEGHVDSKSYRHRVRRRTCWTIGISHLIQGGRRIRLGGWVGERSRARNACKRHV